MMEVFKVVLVLCCLGDVYTLQCLNPDGKPVDWFIVYKLPILKHNQSNPILLHGLGYFYMDADKPQFQLSKGSINDTNQSVFTTLQQIYTAQDDSIFYAMYNDHPPNSEPSMNHGHTKGVVAFDHIQGFWLVHSTPQFPPVKKQGYLWPHSATFYGQSFLCVTYGYNMIDKIGQQFLYNYPKFYDFMLNKKILNDNPNMAKVMAGGKVTSPPWDHSIKLISSGGVVFHSYAKYSYFHEDLYDAWLAPTLNSSLLTETWQNSGSKLQSNCSGRYKVYNVQHISLPEGISFSETKDHSKWAIAVNGEPWVCIGDINRDASQEKRGGGTVCFSNKDAWKNYNSIISVTEACHLQLSQSRFNTADRRINIQLSN